MPLYETLQGRKSEDTALARVGTQPGRISHCYAVGRSELDDGARRELAELIYSYLVGRAVCGFTAKNLNKLFQSLSTEFKANGPSVAVFAEGFSDSDGDSSRCPDDEAFRRGVLTGTAYAISPGPRLVDILWELEVASRTELSEHVLPQSWSDDWPLPDGDLAEPASLEQETILRNAKLHPPGNLTLLSGGLNISSGEARASTKRRNSSKSEARGATLATLATLAVDI